MTDYLSKPSDGNQQLPNATAVLVLGILSIVVCFVCGIVALVISNKDLASYKAHPEDYSLSSYNNIKAGRVCAIIGIAFQVVLIIAYVAFVAFMVNNIERFK
jgi:hypothetical protein